MTTSDDWGSEWEKARDKGIYRMTVAVLRDPSLRYRMPMGCRPVDIGLYPDDLRPDFERLEALAPRDDTWLTTQCSCCELPCVMGPHQRTTYELDPEHFAVLCFPCAVSIMGPGVTLEPQGGK